MGSHSHAEHEHPHQHPHGEAHAAVAVQGDCGSCAAHRPRVPVDRTGRWGWLAGIVPILACALCPVCLSAYATILSVFGVGFAISEGQHAILLIVAVVAALASGAWRARVTRRFGPLGLTALGCLLLIFADVLHENRPLSLFGIALLIASMVWDRRAAKQPRH
jgi:uncharacterized membrane protein (UPF0136 family)